MGEYLPGRFHWLDYLLVYIAYMVPAKQADRHCQVCSWECGVEGQVPDAVAMTRYVDVVE